MEQKEEARELEEEEEGVQVQAEARELQEEEERVQVQAGEEELMQFPVQELAGEEGGAAEMLRRRTES